MNSKDFFKFKLNKKARQTKKTKKKLNGRKIFFVLGKNNKKIIDKGRISCRPGMSKGINGKNKVIDNKVINKPLSFLKYFFIYVILTKFSIYFKG